MKKIPYISFALLSFVLLVACSNKDSEFFNEVTIQVPNQLVIDTQSSYTTQDTLWMHTAFSRYLPEENFTNLLDVYQSSGQAAGFQFAFILEKKATNGTWEFYALSANLIEELGDVQENDGYYTGLSVYNETAKTYDFRSGLKLTEAGEYRINFGYESLINRAVILRSLSQANNLVVNIRSTVQALDASGYYSFTVN
ncbi:MAG: hypothetical protein NTX74_08715 [Flavobacterium sp.]|nr:hypothetical protein [Flavobacterium sp.]